MAQLRGIFPATATAFDNDGALDPAAQRKIIRHQLDAGVHGFYLCGGTGEGLSLTTAEHRAVVETVLDEVAGKVPVISHVGAFQIPDALERAGDARSLGVDAVASLPPAYFYKPDDEGMVQYYTELAATAAPLPVLIYNIPGRTGIAMTPELYDRLLAIDNVVGMKDSSGDLFGIGRFAAQKPEAVLFCGDDTQAFPAMLAGATGAIGLTYNMVPRSFVQLWDEMQSGDLKAAAATQSRINEFIAVILTVETIAAAKQTMDWMGLGCGLPRRPIRRLREHEQERLRGGLDSIGFFDGSL